MKLILLFLLIFNLANAAWVMFNDGKDTYIYNNVSGDIYIRYNKGGKNYEDVFVKMPSGLILDSKHSNIEKKDHSDISRDILLNNLHNIQNDTLNRALE